MRRTLPRVLIGQALASLASFATVLALGRWGGESQLGLFSLGMSAQFLALSLTDTLIATPYTYQRAQPERLAGDLVMAAAWGVLALALAFGAVLTVLTVLMPTDVFGLATLWPALPLALAAAALREFRRRHLLVDGAAAALLRLDASGAVVQIAGLALLVFTQQLSARSALVWMTLAAALPLLPLLGRARLQRLLAARPVATAVVRHFVHYGHWLLLGGLCHVASVQAYPWLAFAAGGTGLAGRFAAANALLNLMSPLLTGLTNHYRPLLMEARVQLSARDFTVRVLSSLPVFVLPALGLWLALALAGKLALSCLYGSALASAAVALPWLGLGLLAVALGAPLQLGLLALGAPATNLAYHGTALLTLVLAAALAGPLQLEPLSMTFAGANLLATAVLGALFFARSRSG